MPVMSVSVMSIEVLYSSSSAPPDELRRDAFLLTQVGSLMANRDLRALPNVRQPIQRCSVLTRGSCSIVVLLLVSAGFLLVDATLQVSWSCLYYLPAAGAVAAVFLASTSSKGTFFSPLFTGLTFAASDLASLVTLAVLHLPPLKPDCYCFIQHLATAS